MLLARMLDVFPLSNPSFNLFLDMISPLNYICLTLVPLESTDNSNKLVVIWLYATKVW
jgi:hypothetical protein